MASQICSLRGALAGAGSLVLLLLLFAFSGWHAPSFRSDRANHGSDNDASGLLDHAYNATLGFQKIFVINIPARSDHRDSMSLAAALTGLQIEYVDGVTEFNEKILPPGAADAALSKGNIGAWRAHMNVARKIVEENITSALVLEGDVDWDLRIKSQMRDFAKASQLLLQPGRKEEHMNVEDTVTEAARTSPYGDVDQWDLLWVGHCGANFPKSEEGHNIPTGRVAINNDVTVAETQHLQVQFGSDDILTQYPNHTRVVSRARNNVCTLAYGMSQQGARRFLYQTAIKKLDAATDLMFRYLCDGTDGRPMHTCLTVQPQLFQHHRPEAVMNTFSSINDHGAKYNDKAFTRNIRWATRVNFPQLIYGETDYFDYLQDGQPGYDFGF